METDEQNGTSSATRRLLVVDTAASKLIFVDGETLEVLQTLDAPPMPHEVIFDGASRLAYVSVPYKDGFVGNYEEANTLILVLDVDKMAIVEDIDITPHFGPHALAVSADGSTLFVSCESDGGCVISYDRVGRRIAAVTPVDATAPHWMAVLDNGKVYTANKDDTYISVADLTTAKLLKKLPAMHGTESAVASVDNRNVYVSSRRSPELYVIDTAREEIERVIELPEPAGMLAVTPDGAKLLINYFNFPVWRKEPPTQAYVQTLDLATGILGDRIAVGNFPINIVSSPDSRTAYVTSYVAGTVSAIDLASGALRRAVVGKGLHGLALIEDAPAAVSPASWAPETSS